jgi:hypothetical protein
MEFSFSTREVFSKFPSFSPIAILSLFQNLQEEDPEATHETSSGHGSG